MTQGRADAERDDEQDSMPHLRTTDEFAQVPDAMPLHKFAQTGDDVLYATP